MNRFPVVAAAVAVAAAGVAAVWEAGAAARVLAAQPLARHLRPVGRHRSQEAGLVLLSDRVPAR
jgi:hypothetical protein